MRNTRISFACFCCIFFNLSILAQSSDPFKTRAEHIAEARMVAMSTSYDIETTTQLTKFTSRATGVIYNDYFVISTADIVQNNDSTTVNGQVVEVVKVDKQRNLAAFRFVTNPNFSQLEIEVEPLAPGTEIFSTVAGNKTLHGAVVGYTKDGDLVTDMTEITDNRGRGSGSGIFGPDGKLAGLNASMSKAFVKTANGIKEVKVIVAISGKNIWEFIQDPKGSKYKCRICHHKISLSEDLIPDPGQYYKLIHVDCANKHPDVANKPAKKSSWTKALPWNWFRH